MQTIKQVLMKRDGLDETEAEERIDEAKEQLLECLERGGTLCEAEEIIKDEFGLEPDYLWELMP